MITFETGVLGFFERYVPGGGALGRDRIVTLLPSIMKGSHLDYDRNRDERRDDWERQSSSSAPQRHYSSHAASDSPLRKRHRQRNDDKWSSNNGTYVK